MTHQDIIYKDLAKEYALDVATIEKICRYQFRFVAEQIPKDGFKAVRLPFWGVYKPIKGRLSRHLLKQEKLKEEQDDLRAAE